MLMMGQGMYKFWWCFQIPKGLCPLIFHRSRTKITTMYVLRYYRWKWQYVRKWAAWQCPLWALFWLTLSVSLTNTCTHVTLDSIAPSLTFFSHVIHHHVSSTVTRLKCTIPPLSPFAETTILCCLLNSARTKQENTVGAENNHWSFPLSQFCSSDQRRCEKNWSTWADDTSCTILGMDL